MSSSSLSLYFLPPTPQTLVLYTLLLPLLLLLTTTTTTTTKINIDVRHGGYYLITDGIYEKFGPKRIIDFPPDETTLLGCALGFSQLGILPIVEIPYIKYFDCGIDIFYEIAIQYWLTNGNSSSTSRISINSSSSSSTIGEGT